MNVDNPVDETKKSIIPIGGTLGILAYGYRGVMMWRQERQKHYEEQIAKSQNNGDQHEEN